MTEVKNDPDAQPEGDMHMERRVVYETRSATSSKNAGVTMLIIAVIAIALITWVVMQMR